MVTGKDVPTTRRGGALSVTMDMFTGDVTRRDQVHTAVALMLGDPDAVNMALLKDRLRLGPGLLQLFKPRHALVGQVVHEG